MNKTQFFIFKSLRCKNVGGYSPEAPVLVLPMSNGFSIIGLIVLRKKENSIFNFVGILSCSLKAVFHLQHVTLSSR